MPLLGLIDWIIIALFWLLTEFMGICLIMLYLYELLSFKPKEYWRPSTHFLVDLPEGKEEWEYFRHRYVEAPRNYHHFKYEREQKLKWYHRLVVGA